MPGRSNSGPTPNTYPFRLCWRWHGWSCGLRMKSLTQSQINKIVFLLSRFLVRGYLLHIDDNKLLLQLTSKLRCRQCTIDHKTSCLAVRARLEGRFIRALINPHHVPLLKQALTRKIHLASGVRPCTPHSSLLAHPLSLPISPRALTLKIPSRSLNPFSRHPVKVGFAKGELCRNDYMNVCIESAQMSMSGSALLESKETCTEKGQAAER